MAISDKQTLTGDQLSVGGLLGIKAADSLQLLRSIERGFSFDALECVRRETGWPMERLAISIGISPRTLSRRKKEKKLTPSESDRLVSVARLLARSIELFEGNQEKAFRWFTNPNRALGGLPPLEMAGTETGGREVENFIGRLEYGIFS